MKVKYVYYKIMLLGLIVSFVIPSLFVILTLFFLPQDTTRIIIIQDGTTYNVLLYFLLFVSIFIILILYIYRNKILYYQIETERAPRTLRQNIKHIYLLSMVIYIPTASITIYGCVLYLVKIDNDPFWVLLLFYFLSLFSFAINKPKRHNLSKFIHSLMNGNV